MKRILIILFLISVVLSRSFAQNVDAFLEKGSGYLGQSVIFHIVLQDFDVSDLPVPELKGFDQFSWSYQGRSSRIQSSVSTNGTRRTQSIDYSYELKPVHVGNLTVPSVEIEVDGKIYRTPSRILQVKPPSSLEGFDFRVAVDNEQVYPGMEFKLKTVWFFTGRVANPDFSVPLLGHPDIEVIEPVPPQNNGADIYRFNVGGVESYAVQGAEYAGGIQYTTLTLEWVLVAKRAGLNLSALSTLAFDQQTGTDTWLRPVYTRRMIPSNPLDIVVKSLPEGLGEAADLIGKSDPQFEVSLSPDKGYVGDPLELIIQMGGIFGIKDKENFPLEDMIDTRIFKVSLQSVNYNAEENRKTFKYIVRSGSSGNLEFPSLSLEYFNTAHEDVRQVISEPIPLSLEATGASSEVDINIEAVEKIDEDKLDVSHNEAAAIVLSRRNRSYAGLFSSDSGIVLISILILTLVGMAGAFAWLIYQKRQKKWPEEWLDLRQKYDSGSEHSAETVYRIVHRVFRELFLKEADFEGKEIIIELEKRVFSGEAEQNVSLEFFWKIDRCIQVFYGGKS